MHLVWVPCNCADCFSPEIIESQAFFLGLDIPYSDKATTTSGHHDMRNLLVPVQTFDIVSPGGGISQPEGIRDIVEVRNEELYTG